MELLLFSLFMKHAFADLFLQSFRTPGNKAQLLSKSNALHSGDHGILTVLVFLAFGFQLEVALVLGLIDFILHYTIDGLKTKFVQYKGWSRDGRVFWRLQSLDQMLHYATYGFLIFLVDIYHVL